MGRAATERAAWNECLALMAGGMSGQWRVEGKD